MIKVYRARAPKIVDPKFAQLLTEASSGKATYVPGAGKQSSQLQVKGILSKDESKAMTKLLLAGNSKEDAELWGKAIQQ